MNFRNRRKFLRLKVYHLAKYRPLASDKEPGPYLIASIRDIGAGGICLRSEEYLPLSTLIEVRINFPNISTSVSALAKVVWIRNIKKFKFYEMGAEFVEISDSMKEDIDKQVETVFNKLSKKNN